MHISFQNNENIFIVLELVRKGKNYEYILVIFGTFSFFPAFKNVLFC